MNLSSLFNREQIKSETKETKELPGLRGPLTAREALNAILPAVRQIDPEFKLTFVGSGDSINHQGRAYRWDFFFEFERRQEFGDFTVRLCPQDGDDEGPWCMDLRLRPLKSPLTKSIKVPPGPARPMLPLEFRDSDEAVQAMGEQGADWISGDTHMTLSSKVLSNGEAVWHTICWDKTYQTPFA